MLDVDALFDEITRPDATPVPADTGQPLSPVNTGMQSVPACPNLYSINGPAFSISRRKTRSSINDLAEVSQVSQAVPCVFSTEGSSASDETREATAPGAREGRQSEQFRAAKSADNEAWQADEAKRNQAAFMVCCVFNDPNDTEVDRQEAYRWSLASRGAFDWLTSRNNHPAFSTDDNRRPCACCASLAPSSWRCSAVDRGELTARRPYYPNVFLLQRCTAFAPMLGDPDQRPVDLRWPGLGRPVGEACKDG
jgi:hypothetical protein